MPRPVGALVRELLRDGPPVEIRVTGWSMSPCVRDGDVVTVAPGGRARFGDVVAFFRGDRWLVLHRVIRVRGDALETRGDASPDRDGPTPRAELAGVVVEVRRGERRVRLGLGPERVLVAWLSRLGWWIPLLRPLRWFVRLGSRAP